MTHLTIHPLLLAVRDCHAGSQDMHDPEHAGFTETLTRVLCDAFLTEDTEGVLPTLVTDPGVGILKMDVSEAEETVAPGSVLAIGEIIGAFRTRSLDTTGGGHVRVQSGNFAMCSPFTRIDQLLCDPVLMNGGFLGFVDPIYEDSLILVGMTKAALAEWQMRHCNATPDMAEEDFALA